jgi:hypothetical protein
MHTHDGDDELLGTLRQVGVDFAKPRELNFYFLFPGEAEADRARQQLEQQKLDCDKMKIDVPWWKRLFARPQWALCATQTMPLDEARIKGMTTQFRQIAAECHGQYDGWEANVMDDQIDADQLDRLS